MTMPNNYGMLKKRKNKKKDAAREEEEVDCFTVTCVLLMQESMQLLLS